jgi:membrane associated rhomboid family serine protease
VAVTGVEQERELVLPLLRQCAAAAPLPCDAREFARTHDLAWERVECCLEVLAEAGALVQEPGSDRVVLTPEGARLLQEAPALAKFCARAEQELPPPGGDVLHWRIIHQTLRTTPWPVVNRVLIWANLLVFGLGILLAARHNLAFEFIMPFRMQMGGLAVVQNANLDEVLRTTGRLERQDVPKGDWWRLLACCFVHFSIIHLAMNMYALRVVGADAEWMWGQFRYLVIYLLAALGGSCAALTTAEAVVGASGAICGVAAAEAVWLLCNRRYLPRRPVRRQLLNLLLAGLLIGLLSLAPGVSGAAHLGGAVVGAAAALLLHFHRFGGSVIRTVALLGLLALPVGCLVGLKQVSAHWTEADRAGLARGEIPSRRHLRTIDEKAIRFQKEQLKDLLGTHPRRRDAAAVRRAVAELDGHIARFRQAAQQLDDLPVQPSKEAEEFRQAGTAYFGKRADYMAAARRALKEGRKGDELEEAEAEAARAQRRWQKALGRPVPLPGQKR